MNCFLVVVIEPPEPNGLLFWTQSHQNLGCRMGEGLLEASWGCEGHILTLPSSWPGLKALFSSPFLEATFEVEETPRPHTPRAPRPEQSRPLPAHGTWKLLTPSFPTGDPKSSSRSNRVSHFLLHTQQPGLRGLLYLEFYDRKYLKMKMKEA